MRNMNWAIVTVFGLCGFLLTLPAAAQIRSHSVSLTFSQTALPQGGVSYGLLAAPFALDTAIGPFSDLSLVAPDGTSFDKFAQIEEPSFTDLAAVAFGKWTTIETATSGQTYNYQFNVPAFSLADVFTQIPIISSPLSGSVVPTDFTVNWSFDQGGTPSSRGVKTGPPSTVQLLSTQFGPSGYYSVEFKTKLLGPPPGLFTMQASVQSTLTGPTLVVPVTPALAGATFRFDSEFDTLSAPATYQVVPEPNGTKLLLAAVVFAIVVLWFRLVRRVLGH